MNKFWDTSWKWWRSLGDKKGWFVEGIRMVGLWECWVCAEFIFKKRLRLLETLGKLGYALHVRISEGIKLFLVPILDNVPIKVPECSCGFAHAVFEHWGCCWCQKKTMIATWEMSEKIWSTKSHSYHVVVILYVNWLGQLVTWNICLCGNIGKLWNCLLFVGYPQLSNLIVLNMIIICLKC